MQASAKTFLKSRKTPWEIRFHLRRWIAQSLPQISSTQRFFLFLLRYIPYFGVRFWDIDMWTHLRKGWWLGGDNWDVSRHVQTPSLSLVIVDNPLNNLLIYIWWVFGFWTGITTTLDVCGYVPFKDSGASQQKQWQCFIFIHNSTRRRW